MSEQAAPEDKYLNDCGKGLVLEGDEESLVTFPSLLT
jgi:hypothetical protein